jgi:hypothetical protein
MCEAAFADKETHLFRMPLCIPTASHVLMYCEVLDVIMLFQPNVAVKWLEQLV